MLFRSDDFIVKADLVQVSATVIQVVDLSAVRGVLVSGFLNLVVIAAKVRISRPNTSRLDLV